MSAKLQWRQKPKKSPHTKLSKLNIVIGNEHPSEEKISSSNESYNKCKSIRNGENLTKQNKKENGWTDGIHEDPSLIMRSM